MKKILLTIDTEFIVSKNEILGINGRNGLKDILSILDEFEVPAIFFVDYYESLKWGDEIFEWVTESIAKAGHQIELHLHPGIFGNHVYMWQYDYAQQTALLNQSIGLFEKFTNRLPRYFRAGSYAANDETLDILKKRGFIADLSFQYNQKRCKISDFPSVNKIQETNGLLEIPTTVYKYWFLKNKYNSINFEWSSFRELKEISNQIKDSDLNYFVIMMHSFSFLKRWNRKKLSKNNAQKKKFRRYLAFAKANDFQFVSLDDFYKDYQNGLIDTSHDFTPHIKNPWIIFSGLLEKLKMKFIVNKKFRLKFLSAVFAALISMLFLLYILFFNSISPGYNEVKDIDINITAWNADKDISTIENYFIEFGGYKNKTKHFEDVDGIIFRKPYTDTRKYKMRTKTDTMYIPIDMSGHIIKAYTAFIHSKDSVHIEKINLYSEWLKENVVLKDEFAMWPYPYKFTKYDIDFDWCGSWALGNVLSAISRKIALSNDSSFHTLANQAVHSFEVPVEEGGILFVDESNNYWYEEYPSIPPSHVLNGHINGLMGLYDYWRITKNKKAKFLFDKGIETLENKLHIFDAGYWTYYDDMYPYNADYFYHKAVHIPQLQVLYQMTGKEIFSNYAQKWEHYLKEPNYTLYKIKMIYDGLHRRVTYKSFFTWGKN